MFVAYEVPMWSRTRNRPAVAIGTGVGAAVLGALALGAIAIGALAIAKLVVGRLNVREAWLRDINIENLTVRRLKLLDKEDDYNPWDAA